jgi:hypothetical protein
MKIFELFDSDAGTAVKKAAGKIGSNAIQGVGDFIKGARGGKDVINPLTGKSVFSAFDHIKTPPGTTRSIKANLPAQEQFDKVLVTMYGSNGKSDKLRQDWANAINSGDKNKVSELGQRPEYRNERRPEVLDGDKLKTSTATVIEDLIRMTKAGFEFSAHPPQKEKPADNAQPTADDRL